MEPDLSHHSIALTKKAWPLWTAFLGSHVWGNPNSKALCQQLTFRALQTLFQLALLVWAYYHLLLQRRRL